MVKRLGYLILIIIVSIVVFILFKTKQDQSLYDDLLLVEVKRGNEECDEYKNLWEVKTVTPKNYEFIKEHQIYFTNKIKNLDSTYRSLVVIGFLNKKKRSDDFIGCSDSWLFYDSLFIVK